MPESLQQRIEKIRLWAKDPDRAASHILVTILAVIILVAIALWIVWIVPKHEAAAILDPEKRLTLENELRKTLTQIVLSIFGLFILYFTWQRARAGDKTVQIMEQGHITDRYTKAIEQLGKLDGDKPNIEVRLGAIYALERIARDSPRDHWTIMEVLTAYVRQNAPVVNPGETPPTPPPRRPPTHNPAILTLLGPPPPRPKARAPRSTTRPLLNSSAKRRSPPRKPQGRKLYACQSDRSKPLGRQAAEREPVVGQTAGRTTQCCQIRRSILHKRRPSGRIPRKRRPTHRRRPR